LEFKPWVLEADGIIRNKLNLKSKAGTGNWAFEICCIYLSLSQINKISGTHWTTAAILDFVIFYLKGNISKTIQQNSIFFFAMFFLINIQKNYLRKQRF
jgi:hypothetical protein